MSFKVQFKQCQISWDRVLAKVVTIGAMLALAVLLCFMAVALATMIYTDFFLFIKTVRAVVVLLGIVITMLAVLSYVPPALCALWKMYVPRKGDKHDVV